MKKKSEKIYCTGTMLNSIILNSYGNGIHLGSDKFL